LGRQTVTQKIRCTTIVIDTGQSLKADRWNSGIPRDHALLPEPAEGGRSVWRFSGLLSGVPKTEVFGIAWQVTYGVRTDPLIFKRLRVLLLVCQHLNLNPAVATAKTGHSPQPQPIAEKEVVPKQMMCAAVGNCWQ
jgi:hypothetical protein